MDGRPESSDEREKRPAHRRRARPTSLPYSDLDLSRWRDYPEVETDSLWIIPSRDSTAGHRLDYHGNYVPQIARQLYSRYTRRGDVVLDLFLGSGTSAIEAVRMGRRCVGVELKPDLVEYVRGKFPPEVAESSLRLVVGDSSSDEVMPLARGALAGLGASAAQLLVLHPPYDDIIRFSDRPEDLSNAASTDDFLARFLQVARNGFDLLEPGRFAALIIGDKYSRGELTPLGFYCLAKMNEAGFRTKALVVKNIAGNEIGKGARSNLWRYRALAGGFYVFKHEYIVVFQKPR